ncbi:MAG TPA: transposase, partial [Gemmata sp.]|nr:transposase [Gemmata sp.]
RVFEYLAGTLNALKCPAIIVGGMPDHVHLLFVQARTLALSEVVEEVKKESSKWAKAVVHRDFYWQNGYGAFSVSPSNVEAVSRYIANQEANHSKRDFKDELRELLRANGIEWDEHYVWD